MNCLLSGPFIGRIRNAWRDPNSARAAVNEHSPQFLQNLDLGVFKSCLTADGNDPFAQTFQDSSATKFAFPSDWPFVGRVLVLAPLLEGPYEIVQLNYLV